jgi:hypothetical protein
MIPMAEQIQKTITIHVLPVNDIPVAYANQWQSFEDIYKLKKHYMHQILTMMI